MHELPLLLNIVVALAYALVGGALARWAQLPPLVGYLVAGVAIGPATPGFVGDSATIGQLAELGVLFLMFGVGLHFSFADLWQVRTIAIPGAAIQIVVAAGLGYLLTQRWGWSPGASLILGLAVSVASTVVLLRALMDHALLDSVHGRVAIGWLVVQDLATVAILVFLPLTVHAGGQSRAAVALLAVAKAALFVGLMLVAGRRLIPWILDRVVRFRSRELFIVTGLTLAIGTALLSSAWFGVSLALGAFIAGVVVGESPYSHQVGADLLPFREVFQVLFFVSVGMLVNPAHLIDHWKEVISLSLLVIAGNGFLGAAIGFAFPFPARTALVVGAGLSQIGEFSFIVGQSGMALGLLDPSQYSLILATALISITANTFVFRLIDPFEQMLKRHPAIWRRVNRHGPAPSPKTVRQHHVVIVGWGHVGQHISDVLGALNVERLVIEADAGAAEQLNKAGVPTLFGDAANSEILMHADLEQARALVVTIPDEPAAAIIVAAARLRAPRLHIVARAATREGSRHLAALGANEIVRPELEGGLQVLRRTLLTLGFPMRRVQDYADAIRQAEVVPSADDGARLLTSLANSDLDLAWLPLVSGSPLVNRSVAEANLRPATGVSIVAISRGGAITNTPAPDFVMAEHDEIAVIGSAAQIEQARHFAANTPSS